MARLSVGAARGKPETPELLKYFWELWTHENFQEVWVKGVKLDIETFQKMVWNMDFANMAPQDAKLWSEIMKLPVPESDGDYVRCIQTIRALIGYMEWKLHEIEKRAIRFTEQNAAR